jgi:3-oxoadipate enol-lactonase
LIADALRPLAEQPALADYRVIQYHRRGYGESSGEPPSTFALDADDARGLLDHLDASPAHIVGHSSGADIILELAAGTPEVARSLVLLEPALATQIPNAAASGEAMQKVLAPIEQGDVESACDRFLHFVFGPDYRAMIAKNVSPDAWSQVLKDAEDTFQGDFPSIGTWELSPERAAAISCPVLLVLGLDSDDTCRQALETLGLQVPPFQLFRESIELLRALLPQAEVATLEGVNHSLQMQDARAVANAVGPFLAGHHATVTA